MGPKSKSHRRSSSVMSVIPIEILASEILPRLPPTTLIRLKCLNKFFYNYISSKLFIDLQVHHSAVSNSNTPLMVFVALKSYQQCLYLLDVDSLAACYISLPPPFRDRLRSLHVVGCCNGLLCLTSCNTGWNSNMYFAMIVNPSTGSVVSNISLSMMVNSNPCTSKITQNVTYSGFGYHSLDKDYKLVVEYQYHREQQNPLLVTIYRKVSVLSMKSNSWSCIETAYVGDYTSPMIIGPSQICVPTPFSTCVLIDNYLMHWLLKSLAGNWNVVCFDLEKQRWAADIPLPDNFRDYDRDIICGVDLGVVDGCLCFSLHNYDDKFHVWIMKEYGVHGSWTKLFIDIPGNRGHPYIPFFTYQHASRKEILLAKRRPSRGGSQTCILYNIRDKTAKKFRYTGTPREFEPRLLCLGSLAFGDSQTQKCKGTQHNCLKIDDEVKVLQVNPTQPNPT